MKPSASVVPDKYPVCGFPVRSMPDFEVGDLYLFHPSDPRCPSESSLWGLFDRCEGERILLESSSEGTLSEFKAWHPLPEEYRYCRPATRPELRDYMWALGFYEAR